MAAMSKWYDIDSHYFISTLVLTMALQYTCFLIAYGLQIDKITDISGCFNFIVVLMIPFFGSMFYYPRQIIATLLLCTTRAELACFLLCRVIKRGKDERFDTLREHFWSFGAFWTLQIIWIWGVCLNTIFLNAESVNPDLSIGDYTATGIFVIGFLVQVCMYTQ